MSTRYKKSPYTARVMLHPNTSLRAATVHQICKAVQREIHMLCSRKYGDSVLRETSSTAVTNFSWASIVQELKSQAPTLYTLIKSGCRVPTHALGMTGSLLLKARNKHLALPQAVISVVMYAGHCSKQVSSSCINYIYMCVCVYVCNLACTSFKNHKLHERYLLYFMHRYSGA